MKHTALITLFFTILFCTNCTKEEVNNTKPLILLKTGDYTKNDDFVPVGGKLKFGITATDGGAILTNLRIQRIVDGEVIIELDKGIFIKDGGLDYEFNAVKSFASQEIWKFFVMNSNRDSAITTLTVNLGSGSAYGEINYYSSLIIGMQSNINLPNYVDLHLGNLYNLGTISGHESEIDLVGFVYLTSGIMSPTLCCPAYTGSSSVTTHYPEIGTWSVRNSILYDYYSSDNNLVDPTLFSNAQNDSLLVASYKPGNVSGLCKYCYTGKIVPFRTEDGKYGLVHIIHADQTQDGYMELEIKIQK